MESRFLAPQLHETTATLLPLLLSGQESRWLKGSVGLLLFSFSLASRSCAAWFQCLKNHCFIHLVPFSGCCNIWVNPTSFHHHGQNREFPNTELSFNFLFLVILFWFILKYVCFMFTVTCYFLRFQFLPVAPWTVKTYHFIDSTWGYGFL